MITGQRESGFLYIYNPLVLIYIYWAFHLNPSRVRLLSGSPTVCHAGDDVTALSSALLVSGFRLLPPPFPGGGGGNEPVRLFSFHKWKIVPLRGFTPKAVYFNF